MAFIFTDTGRGNGGMKTPEFECPKCGHEMYVEITGTGDHVYNHVTECGDCYEELVDFVFSEFIKDGFSMNSSFIRQALKYIDQFLHKKCDEMNEEDEDEEDV